MRNDELIHEKNELGDQQCHVRKGLTAGREALFNGIGGGMGNCHGGAKNRKGSGRFSSLFLLILFLMGSLLSACGGGTGGNPSGSPQGGSAAPSGGTDKPLEKVTVTLDWFPNTNHSGLYTAKEKGFYKEEGLDVEIIQPGENTAEQLVATGKADFGVSAAEGITQARATDLPVVSIAAIIQHNTSAFASLPEAGIERPKDFEGKKYGGWGSPTEEATIKALMEKDGADSSKWTNITLGQTDFFSSIGKQADFEWIYYGWDGVEAERRGMKLSTLFLRDLDPNLDNYTPILVTNEDHVKNKADLVKRFMAATAKGYELAIAKPDEAAGYLIKNAPELNQELVKRSQAYLAKEYQSDAPQWGWQKKEVWDRYVTWMTDHKLLPKAIDVDQMFTNDFLPQK